MSYDFWGAWDGELGMNAPLYARSGLTGGKEKWNVVGKQFYRISDYRLHSTF